LVNAEDLVSPIESFSDVPTVIMRARAEYLEMPGMCLTMPQAARLFNINLDVCAIMLDVLVGDGFLSRSGNRYARANNGRRSA
jgi:hypothetical protein